jgi:hypothetical protein
MRLPLWAYPNIRAAAALIGVAASTISRRGDLRYLERGDRDKVLAPAEVMRLASIYMQRSLNDVAQELIEGVASRDAGAAAEVTEEVERFFEESRETPEKRERFLAEARRLLPADLYGQVESAVDTEAPDPPGELDGQHPGPAED